MKGYLNEMYGTVKRTLPALVIGAGIAAGTLDAKVVNAQDAISPKDVQEVLSEKDQRFLQMDYVQLADALKKGKFGILMIYRESPELRPAKGINLNLAGDLDCDGKIDYFGYFNYYFNAERFSGLIPNIMNSETNGQEVIVEVLDKLHWADSQAFARHNLYFTDEGLGFYSPATTTSSPNWRSSETNGFIRLKEYGHKILNDPASAEKDVLENLRRLYILLSKTPGALKTKAVVFSKCDIS